MRENRFQAIAHARRAESICLVLSTLGRQGSVGLMERLVDLVRGYGKQNVFTVLTGELVPSTPGQIAGKTNFEKKDIAFIIVGCPRLAMDWGLEYDGYTLISPHEAYIAFGQEIGPHQMDYFASDGGPWTNYGGSRDGSIQKVGGSSAKEKLREKWLKRKAELAQNVCQC